MLQLRCKDENMSIDEIHNLALRVQSIVGDFNVPLLINDHVEVAADIKAHGVHVGQGDMPASRAREIMGKDAIVGITAFTPEHFENINPEIIDYAGTGPFFPTKTDKGKPLLGEEKFSKLVAISPVPVVGIGGIEASNAEMVIHAGAKGVAVMRYISCSDNPKAAAAKLLDVVNNAKQ